MRHALRTSLLLIAASVCSCAGDPPQLGPGGIVPVGTTPGSMQDVAGESLTGTPPPDASPDAAPPTSPDGIDLAHTIVFNSPADVAGWTIGTTITQIAFNADGVHLEFDKRDGAGRWPDITPPGWDGPLQYTLWLALDVNGQWATSGIIQFWYGLDSSGGDITVGDQIRSNWVYDGRWGTMAGQQPAVGEVVGFFVTAGNARGVTDDSGSAIVNGQPLKERSNVVAVPFPGAHAVINF